MRRLLSYLPLVLIALFLVIGALGRLGEQEPSYENPRRPEADAKQGWQGEEGGALPPPTGREPSVNVEVSPTPQSGQGTAFSIDPRGVWMTARHVADSCDRLFVLTAPRQGLRVLNTYIHPDADIAILRTRRGAPALRFSEAALNQGEHGYHFGFPSGDAAAVHSRLLGRRVMRVHGRYRTAEPVVAWAEARRVPESHGSLGGISGGPAFDAAGEVIGTTVAGSVRRGRVYTTAPVSIRNALRRAGLTPSVNGRRSAGPIDPRNFAERGAALREELSVTRVVCLVENGRSGRRGRK